MREIDFYEISDYTTEARGKIKRIYLHWSAGTYDGVFSDYHLNITGDGRIYTDMDSLTERKWHTYMRNTGAIGISLCCCYEAKPPNNYGEYPPTEVQLDMMSKIIAKLCIEIGLPLNYVTVKTHAEVADIDGYGLGSGDPETKWDLYGMGDDIREKANHYYNLWTSSYQ